MFLMRVWGSLEWGARHTVAFGVVEHVLEATMTRYAAAAEEEEEALD